MIELYRDYEDLTLDIMSLVERYHKVRESDKYNREEVQDIRDELAEAMTIGVTVMSEMEHKLNRAEYERKQCEAEVLIRVKKEMNNARGATTEAGKRAILECKEQYEAEIEAKHHFKQFKLFYDSLNQLSNAISSRLRGLDKHERHE